MTVDTYGRIMSGAAIVLSGVTVGVTGGTTLIRDPMSLAAFAFIVIGCAIAAFGGFVIGRRME